MQKQELIDFMLGTGEYDTVSAAEQAIQNKMKECLDAGMNETQAWNSTAEFMELTLGNDNSLYRTREEAKNGCLREAEACIKYSTKATEYFRKGDFYNGFRMFDVAETASKCTMQAHEALWKLTKGELTEDEFNAFEQAEIAVGKFHTCKVVLSEGRK